MLIYYLFISRVIGERYQLALGVTRRQVCKKAVDIASTGSIFRKNRPDSGVQSKMQSAHWKNWFPRPSNNAVPLIITRMIYRAFRVARGSLHQRDPAWSILLIYSWYAFVISRSASSFFFLFFIPWKFLVFLSRQIFLLTLDELQAKYANVNRSRLASDYRKHRAAYHWKNAISFVISNPFKTRRFRCKKDTRALARWFLNYSIEF